MNGFQRFVIKFVSLFYPVKYYGLENIPEGGAVLVSNHLSLIDSVYLRRMYMGEMYFLAKKELFKNKLMGKIFKSFGAIPIDREKPELRSLLTAASVLKKGSKLLIFPEGTRNKTGTTELQPIKNGSVVLAVKTKTPIVPIMVYKKARLFRRNYLMIGKPFDFSEFYDKQISPVEIESMDSVVREQMIAQQKSFALVLTNRKKSTGVKRQNADSNR